MPICTLDQFKTQTRLKSKLLRFGKLRDHRGKNMEPIDSALFLYHSVRGLRPEQRIRALQQLLAACCVWLKAKAGKTGESTQFRRAAISSLGRDALTELKAAHGARGEDWFNFRKAAALGRGHQFRVKGLSAGYQNERELYVALDKREHPWAAAAVKEVQGQLVLGGLPRGVPDGLRQQALAALTKSFDQLGISDYDAIAKAYTIPSGPDSLAHVHFADKDARISQLLVAWPGLYRDFEDLQGRPYDTTSEPAYMYAVDHYGNLYASIPSGLARHGNFWNHSSFNAGKDVVCAGMIQIHNGVLAHIDTMSGHYKPSRDNIFEFVSLLDEEGIDLSHATAGIADPVLGMPGFVDLHTVRADQFAQNRDILDPAAVRVKP